MSYRDKDRGTFLIEFTDGDKVIFGNNYKKWWEHAREYIYRYKGNREALREHGWNYADLGDVVKSVSLSNQQFYDDGGLKWCEWSGYQQLADEVCRKDGLATVKVEEIVFNNEPALKALLTKKLKEY